MGRQYDVSEEYKAYSTRGREPSALRCLEKHLSEMYEKMCQTRAHFAASINSLVGGMPEDVTPPKPSEVPVGLIAQLDAVCLDIRLEIDRLDLLANRLGALL